jgi:hypothetical protein
MTDCLQGNQWEVKSCQNTDLIQGDFLTFGSGQVTTSNTNYTQPWGTYSLDPQNSGAGYVGQMQHNQVWYDLTLDTSGPKPILIGVSQPSGMSSLMYKGWASAAGGLALGTLAGAFIGLSLGETLWVAAFAAGGSLATSYLVNQEELPNGEAQGSSWTAQGGTQGGSGGSNLIIGESQTQLA